MKYLKVFTDFAGDIEVLGDNEVGRLFRAMLLYAETGEERPLVGNERFLWGTAKRNIDVQRRSYTRKVESMEAARDQNPNNQKPDSEQPEDCCAETENCQKTVQDKDKDKGKEKKTKRNASGDLRVHAPARESLPGRSEELVSAVNDWLDYKREKRQSYTPKGLEMLLNKIRRYADSFGDSAVAEVIRDSMSNSYQGIVWDRLGRKAEERQQGGRTLEDRYAMMNRWANG